MKRTFFVLSLLVVFAACSNPPSKPEKDFRDMRQKVFAQHDSIMNDMTTINTYIMKLKPKIDTTEQGLTYKKASQRLKNANQFMMTWMHSFSDNFPDINNEDKKFTDEGYKERTEKLKGQKKILLQVEQNVDQSISYAKLVLKRGK